MPIPDSLRSDLNVQIIRPLFAEFVGTAFLVLIGCGSTTGGQFYSPSYLEIAFSFGLIVGIMVEIMEPVSGGHINPAVTIAMFIIGNISIFKAIMYVLVQLLGAIAGAAVLFGVLPSNLRSSLGQTSIHSDLSVGQGLGIEILITFVLVFTVLSFIDPTRIDDKVTGAIVVGLSVATCHLWAIRYTGASMNTARTFGPAVIMNAWGHHWVYWVGPNVGGAVAGVLYKYIFARHRSDEALAAPK